jgi:hypothetical protein
MARCWHRACGELSGREARTAARMLKLENDAEDDRRQVAARGGVHGEITRG